MQILPFDVLSDKLQAYRVKPRFKLELNAPVDRLGSPFGLLS